MTLEERIHPSEEMLGKVTDATGHVKKKLKLRDDVSEKTGAPVKVSVDVDKTNQDWTKVTHRVEAVDNLTGYTRTIHEDVKTRKAKHRPK